MLLVEDRFPHHAAVSRLPSSAAGRSYVINCRLARDAGHSGHASRAEGTNLPPLHSRIEGRIVLLSASELRKEQAGEQEDCNDRELCCQSAVLVGRFRWHLRVPGERHSNNLQMEKLTPLRPA